MTHKAGSVWTREPRKPKVPSRTREEIVAAALELLDSDGLDGLSMRKLGAKLGAGATSLYWYVTNKDELLELVFDEVWSDMKLLDPETTPWRQAAQSYARGLRDGMLRHPWTTSIISIKPSVGPNAMALAEWTQRTFKSAGFKGLEVRLADVTLKSWVYGNTVSEIAWLTQSTELMPDPESRKQFLEVTAEAFPGLKDELEEMLRDPEASLKMSFEWGLATVLDGLEKRLVR